VIVDPHLSQARFDRDVAPLRRDGSSYAKTGLKMLDIAFPCLDVALQWITIGREIVVHVQADDYDYRPVRGWWIDASGDPLCIGMSGIPVGCGFQANANPYGEQKAWFCFPGWREYHDHPGHQDRPWPSLRHDRQYGILGLLMQLKADLNKPGVQVQ